MGTLTKRDLIERLCSESTWNREDVKAILHRALDVLMEELERGNRIEFRDFGVFDVKIRAGRTANNPKTLERVAVPPRPSVRFKAGRLMRERLAKAEWPAAELQRRSGGEGDGASSNGESSNGEASRDQTPQIEVRPAREPKAAKRRPA